jgi:CheY-like chemotaxis protein
MTQDDVRVVVVDDDSDTRESMQALLEVVGYDVRTAGDAEEAMAVVAAHQPLCVILDLGLPEVTGAELTGQLRSLYGSELVIIVLTGSTRPEDQEAAELAGVDYVLHKPLDVARLERLLPPLK